MRVLILVLALGVVGCDGSSPAPPDSVPPDSVLPDSVLPDVAVDTTATETLDATADASAPSFIEFPWLDAAPDVGIRICVEAADPEAAPDPTFIDCAIEGEDLTPGPAPPKAEIVVMAYNIERGFGLDGQLDVILNDPAVPVPDILLLSEADRGCARTDGRNITREYAAALGMYYVYAVEFVELDGEPGAHTAHCEHGNAILSRWPLGNVRQLRHAAQVSWFEDTDQFRLGGRVAVVADVRIGEEILRVYSVHFESAVDEWPRWEQAAETADDGLTASGLALVGGDMNCGYYGFDFDFGSDFDKTMKAFEERGWVDAHLSIDPADRVTSPEHSFILDIIVGTEDVFSAPGICPEAVCGGLSDHLPVWTTVKINP